VVTPRVWSCASSADGGVFQRVHHHRVRFRLLAQRGQQLRGARHVLRRRSHAQIHALVQVFQLGRGELL
jgi:hypothetical protein